MPRLPKKMRRAGSVYVRVVLHRYRDGQGHWIEPTADRIENLLAAMVSDIGAKTSFMLDTAWRISVDKVIEGDPMGSIRTFDVTFVAYRLGGFINSKKGLERLLVFVEGALYGRFGLKYGRYDGWPEVTITS